MEEAVSRSSSLEKDENLFIKTGKTRIPGVRTILLVILTGISKEESALLFLQCIGQFLTRFSQSDWFLDVLKISTDAR